MAARLSRPLAFLYPASFQIPPISRGFRSTARRNARKKDAPPPRQASVAFKRAGKVRDKRSGEGGSASGQLNPEFYRDAPPLAGLEELHPDAITPASLATPMAYPDVAVEAFETCGVPHNLENEFKAFARPHSVMRTTTTQVLDILDRAGQQPTTSEESGRLVLTGSSGCGKSTLLMQAVSYCLGRKWITLYTPRAIDWVNSSSAYSYDTRSRLYFQPALARKGLHDLLTINRTALASITVDRDIVYAERGNQFNSGGNLDQLAQIGADDETTAVVVFEAVMTELGRQTRYPILWAIDDFQALYNASLYRDREFRPINSQHLSMPRLALDFASGRKSFARGALLGALSTTDSRFGVPVVLGEALGAQLSARQKAHGAYATRPHQLQHLSKGLRSIHVPSHFSVLEAMSMFDTWAEGNLLHTIPSDELFFAKFTESSGNPRQLGRAMLGTMLS